MGSDGGGCTKPIGCPVIALIIMGLLAGVGILDLELIWDYRYGPAP